MTSPEWVPALTPGEHVFTVADLIDAGARAALLELAQTLQEEDS